MTAIVETVSGRMVDVLNPRPGDFDIHDIATALGNLCRYNGQVKKYYSVAEHSVIMADNVPAEYSLYALIHDAPEAYVSEIVRPLKKTISGIKEIEDRVLKAIVEGLGLDWDNPAAWAAVERADLAILVMEKEHVMRSSQVWPEMDARLEVLDVQPIQDTPRFWSPAIAAEVFMASYEVLRG